MVLPRFFFGISTGISYQKNLVSGWIGFTKKAEVACYPARMRKAPTSPDPDPSATVARSVFAIHITPFKQPLNLPRRKLHIAMARLAGEQYQRLSREQRDAIEGELRDYIEQLRTGKRPTEPPLLLQPQFFGSLKELAVACGREASDARHLWPEIEALVTTPVRFNSLRHKAAAAEKELYLDELEVATTLLSSAVRTGRGEVSWAYDPKILSIMVAPKTYAMLNLQLVGHVKSYTALALYENCRRFISIGKAGPYPIERWQELLSPDGRRPAWDNQYEFMRRIKSAIKELDAIDACDISLEVERVNVANVGKAIQFLVRATDQAKLPFGVPIPKNKELADRLLSIGFDKAQVLAMIDTHGEEYLQVKVDMLAKAQRAPKPVQNPKAWLTAAIEHDYRDAEIQQAHNAQKAQERAALLKRSEETKDAFQQFRAERLRLRFSELEEDRRVSWEVQFADSEAGARADGLMPKAREALFFGWLGQQNHGLLTEPEETDFAAYAVMMLTDK